MKRLNRLGVLLLQHRARVFAVAAVAFTFTAVAAAFAKLMAFGYNALDLAIFHQVVANTAHGRLFAFTIHPHSYLGDHVSPLLILLAPVFRLVPRPETLLVLQVLAVAAAVLPLALLARRLRPALQIIVVAAFLLNPLVHNAALFEFEFLVFSLPLIFGALVAYERRRPGLFLILALLIAGIREDAGLLLIGFGLLGWLDRRSWQWTVLPLLLGLATIGIGMAVSGQANHEQYKFLHYLGWLGSTPHEALATLVRRPWTVLLQLFRLQNLLFVLTLLLLVAGLPLLRLRRLLPALPSAAALLLTSFGGDAISLQTHYPVVLLPYLFWAAIGGLARCAERPPHSLRRLADRPAVFAALLLTVTSVYGWLTMSPLRPGAVMAIRRELRDPRTRIAHALVAAVPKTAAIATGYGLLPFFGGHEQLYALNYVFSGRRQLSQTPYILPGPLDVALVDARDVAFYQAQYGRDTTRFLEGDDRLRSAVNDNKLRPARFVETFVLYDTTGNEPPLVHTNPPTGRAAAANDGVVRLQTIGEQAEELRTEPFTVGAATVMTLPLSLTWLLREPTDLLYHLRVDYRDTRGRIAATRWYPLGYSMNPTSSWDPNTPTTVRFRWIVPPLKVGTYRVVVQPFAREGFLTLDEKLTAYFKTTKQSAGGGAVDIGTLTIANDRYGNTR
ncbi:MAG: DUF2079 domain-containing protein [Candidatus Kerfeldbacteria bacterium]|nr:DUF2079 domain-containing protein [Candidatus Kerfeldbacteria bacterium]